MARHKEPTTVFGHFFHSKVFLWVLFALILLVLFSYFRSYRQNYVVQKEIEDLQTEIAKLEKKQLKSMEILDYVASPAFVEEKARTELNLKKPGEQVVFIDQREVDSPVAESGEYDTMESDTISNPKKWWYYFTKQPINS